MSPVMVPDSVAYEFVFETLKVAPGLDELIGADNIWPRLAPTDVSGIHITHRFYGPEGGEPVRPMGQAMGPIALEWRISAWLPGSDEQVLREPMKIVHAAIGGEDDRGKRHNFLSWDGTGWAIRGLYLGPVVTPDHQAPSGLWQESSSLFRLEMRPKS